MRTCEDCGSRVYNLGCVNCNEEAYIGEQERLTALQYPRWRVEELARKYADEPRVLHNIRLGGD